MTEQEDVNGNDPTMVAPAAASIFPANCIESLRHQNSRTVAPLLMRQARHSKKRYRWVVYTFSKGFALFVKALDTRPA
jgi:hypothetical protein